VRYRSKTSSEGSEVQVIVMSAPDSTLDGMLRVRAATSGARMARALLRKK
jgi:hypothetical protein